MTGLIRLGIWALSFLGYYFFLFYHKRAPELIPAAIVGGITIVIFFAGILNMLTATAYILLALGLCLFIYSVYLMIAKRLEIQPILRNWSFWVLIALSAYMYFAMRNSVLYHYDDFSHWGTMIKSMIVNNRFPRVSEAYIMFQSYPPGTACFVYYFSGFVGDGEGSFLFAQFFMNLSLWITLFSFTKDKQPLAKGFIAVLCICLTVYNVSIRTLLVDTLLAASGAAAAIMIFHYRNRLKEYLPDIAVLLCICVQIKNSGIFFYLVGIAMISAYCYKDKPLLKHRAVLALCVLLPLITIIIWQRHVVYVFDKGLQSKHSLTLINAEKTLSRKSLSDIWQEINLIFSWIVSPAKNRAIPLFFSFPLLYWFRKQSGMEKQQNSALFLLLILISAIAYEIGMMGMYVFSMPHFELVSMNGKDYLRYNGTLLAFLAAIFCSYLVVTLQYRTDNQTIGGLMLKKVLPVICAAGVLAFCLYPRLYLADLRPSKYTNTGSSYNTRMRLEFVLDKCSVKKSKKGLIRIEIPDSGYVNFLMRYLSLSTNYTVKPDLTEEEYEALKSKKEYDLYIDMTSGKCFRPK